jgi:hypothetical protein
METDERITKAEAQLRTRSQIKPKRSGSGKRPRALFSDQQHLKYAPH